MSARAPHVRRVSGFGLSIADARGLRMTVDEGTLVVQEPGRESRIVTSVGRAVRAVWLPPEQSWALVADRGLLPLWLRRASIRQVLRRAGLAASRGSWGDPAGTGGAVVILDDAGPVLSYLVDDMTPWAGDAAERRETSGSIALSRALGLVLEARDDSDVLTRRDLRRVWVGPRRGAAARRTGCLALVVATIVLAFFTWPLGGSGLGLAAGIASLVVAAPVLVQTVRNRRRFKALVGRPPSTDGREVYEPPTAGIGRLSSHLQIGTHDIVVVDEGGAEVWIPGPALGGVARCEIGETDVVLRDARGAVLQILVTDEVAPNPEDRRRLIAACDNAEIAAEEIVLEAALPNIPHSLRHDFMPPGGFAEHDTGHISPAVNVLLPFAGLLLLVGGIAAAVSMPPWGLIVLAGAVLWLGIDLWAVWSFRRWRKDILRREKAR